MKKFTLLFLMLLLFTAAKCQKDSNTADKSDKSSNKKMEKMLEDIYDFDTAIVTFELGGARNGTKVVYIRKNGREEATYTEGNTSIAGFTTPENSVFIRNGFELRSYDFLTNTGTYTEVPEDMRHLGREEGEAMMIAMGAVDDGTMDVGGEKCNKKKIASLNSEACYHKGLQVYASSGFGDIRMTETATDIQINVPVPAEKFELPVSDDELQDIRALQNQVLGGNTADQDSEIPTERFRTPPDIQDEAGEPVDMEEAKKAMEEMQKMMEQYDQ